MTRTAINAAAVAAGYHETLERGTGHYYWAGGEARSWPDPGVYGVLRLDWWTVEQWIDNLRARHAEAARRQTLPDDIAQTVEALRHEHEARWAGRGYGFDAHHGDDHVTFWIEEPATDPCDEAMPQVVYLQLWRQETIGLTRGSVWTAIDDDDEYRVPMAYFYSESAGDLAMHVWGFVTAWLYEIGMQNWEIDA